MFRCVSLLAAVSAFAFAGTPFPPPALDSAGTAGTPSVAVFAGGCFWGMEAVFEHLKGVSDVVSGYAGGLQSTAHYEMVETGRTGHAESVRITFDPSQITYGRLLQVFFSVAHDPTELNRQGPDEGPQYRSAVFYASEEQKRVAEAYIQQLTAARVFKHPIVTQLAPIERFYTAEEYHQHFVERNPHHPYVMYNDLPKLDHLKRQYPELLKQR